MDRNFIRLLCVLKDSKHDELDAMKKIFQKKMNKIDVYRNNGFDTLGLIMVMTETPEITPYL